MIRCEVTVCVCYSCDHPRCREVYMLKDLVEDLVEDYNTPTRVEFELNTQILKSGWSICPDSNRVLCPKHKDVV